MGRQVADAYIEVHGDLKKFRRDLEKANKDLAKASKEAGDESGKSFAEGFENRRKKELDGKWEATLDALYSNKRVDWDKLVGKFDSKNFDEARKSTLSYLDELQSEGIITRKEFGEASNAINKQMGVLNQVEKAAKRAALQEKIRAKAQKKYQQDHLEGMRLNQTFDKLAAKSRREAAKLLNDQIELERDWGRAIKENDRINQKFFDSTYSGMRKIGKERGLEDAFKGMSKAMEDVDWSDFVKGFDRLDDAKKRVIEVTEQMNRANRLNLSDGLAMINSIDKHVKAEGDRIAAMRHTEELTTRNRIQQERYNRSLQAARVAFRAEEVEDGFKRISRAMESTDWSKVTEGSRSMYNWRRRTMESVDQMQRLGRITELESDRMRTSIESVTRNHSRFNVQLDRSPGKFNILGKAMDKFKQSWARMDSTVKMVLTLIAAGASPIATLGSGLSGAVTAIASSLALAANTIVPLAAGVAALAVGGFLAAKAFAQIRAEFPRIQTSLDGISSAWATQAANFGAQWGSSIDNLLDSISTKLGAVDFGTGLGAAFAEITNAFNNIVWDGPFESFLTALGGPLAKASQGLGVGLAGAISMVLSWMTAAAPVAQQLGEMFGAWGQNLANISKSAEGQAQLAKTFERGRDALLAVLDLAGSLGNALGTMFSLGSSSGNDMLNTLTGLVDQFNSWMKTTSGSTQMLQWFEDAKTIMGSLGPVLAGLGQAMDVLVTPQSIAMLTSFMDNIGKALPAIGGLLAAISNFDIFGLVAVALAEVGTALTPVIASLGDLGSALGPVLQGVIRALAPLLNSIGTALAPVIDAVTSLVAYLAPILVPAFEKLSAALAPVIQIIGEVAGVILSVLVPVIGPLLAGIIGNIVGLVEGLSKVFMGVVEVIKGVVNLIVGIFTGDGPKIGAAVQQIFGGLLGIVTGALQAIWNYVMLMFVGRILNLFRAPLMALKGIFQTGFSGVQSAFINFNKAVWNSMGTIVNSIVKFGLDILKGMGNVAKFLWDGLVKGLSSGIGAVLTAIVAAGAAILAAIKTFFGIHSPSTVFMEIGTFLLEGLVNGIVAAIGLVVQAIVTVGTAILAAFTTALDAVAAFFTAAWDVIKLIVSTALSLIVLAVTTYINLVLTVIKTVFQLIVTAITLYVNIWKTVITTVWAAIKLIFSTALAIIKTAVTTVFNFIKGYITTVLAIYKTIITTVWNAIKTVWTNTLNGIKTAVSNVFNAIKTTIDNVINNARRIIDTTLNTIKSIFSNALNAVKSTVSNAFDSIRNTVSNVIGAVRDRISGDLGRIRDFFSSAWSSITSNVSSAFGRISSSVSAGIGNVMSYVGGLPGRIIGALSGLGGRLYSVGSNMMQGFVNGVRNMADNIANAALAAVGNAVDAVKNFLGIRSPSRLFTTFGGYTGEGFANGMDAMGNVISKAGEKMADKATDAFGKSKMFIAGKDAATGIADGLSASKNVISGALGALGGEASFSAQTVGAIKTVPLSSVRDDAQAQKSSGVTLTQGAIQIVTPVKNPALVAKEVIDEFTRYSSM